MEAHQSHDHHVGCYVLEGVADLVVQHVPLDIVGAYLASDRGIAHDFFSTAYLTHQFPVHGGIESDLTQIQFHFYIFLIQHECIGSLVSCAPQIR